MYRSRYAVILITVLVVFALSSTAMAASGDKLIALTFDDGPSDDTQRLLDGLAERGASATFFVQGFKAEVQQDTIKRIVAEGHQLANHSYDHPDLSLLPLGDALLQFTETDEILNQITGGVESYYYRAPYGNSTAELRSRLRCPIFYWSVDTEDWMTRNEDMIRHKIITESFDGAIILAHDTVPATVDAALDAIDHLQKQGYEFVTLKELFRRRGTAAENGEQYYSYLPSGTWKPALEMPEIIAYGSDEMVRISLNSPSQVPVYYTTDGSPVTHGSTQYYGSFVVELPCTIRAVAALDLNGSRSQELVITYEKAPDKQMIPEVSFDEAEQSVDIAADDTCVVTRGMLSDALYRCSGSGEVVPESLFLDVPAASPYACSVTWAYYNGIFSGDGEGHFEPERPVTRQELAKVLVAFLKLTAPSHYTTYADASLIDSWAYEAVQIVSAENLMEGWNGCFYPQEYMSWKDFDALLSRISP